MMSDNKSFNQCRAEQLTYVYFSRLRELVIDNHVQGGDAFDFLMGIGKQKATGQLFAIKIKPYGTAFRQKLKNELKVLYRDIAFPVLLVMFDNKTDRGYYKWIKRPDREGRVLYDATIDVEVLDNLSMKRIIREIKEWYSERRKAIDAAEKRSVSMERAMV